MSRPSPLVWNCLGLFTLCVTAGTLPKALATYSATSVGSARRIVYIGDSLSVGPFGQQMQQFLGEQFGESRFYFFASCGSSPEHWLESEPEFTSKCGYRVKTPRQFLYGTWEKGHPPAPFNTPKVEGIISKTHPDLVLVQLGTNWFDLLEQRSDPETVAKLASILERFAESVHNADFHAELVWITPPDSARFKNVQGTVNELIKSVARRRRFRCIDSSQMVQYVPGQSGHDGVHYSGAAAEKWASGVKAWILNQL